MAAGAAYDYVLRVIVVGDSGTGKSSLVRFFTDRKAINPKGQHRPTIGADYFIRVIKGSPDCETKVRLEIWDTAGQERYRAITRSYYRNSIGVVLVFDVTKPDTFDHIPEWYEDSKVHILPHKAVYILVGNKIDLPDRKVTKKDAEEFAKEYEMHYFETSSITGQQIDVCFTSLGQTIYAKLKSGEIKAESGWEGVTDQKVKLGAENGDDGDEDENGGQRCS